MKKLLLITLIPALLFTASCSKKDSAEADEAQKQEQLTASTKATLTSGLGVWSTSSNTVTYYNSANAVLKVDQRMSTSVWQFDQLWRVANSVTNIDNNNFENTSQYKLVSENSSTYIVLLAGNRLDSDIKWKIESISSTSLTVSRTDISPLSYTINNQGYTADHAKAVYVFTKVK